ncbi:expressed protein [Phakopsora pachyrhizi]|uniref:Expressed protein n=1 Tax=Phakopsora pachyrhizi TaxID=170000 RepID=A0AAV0BCC6_PHAPC|nr:expressed protein [Phakopsora pachyrhizi]
MSGSDALFIIDTSPSKLESKLLEEPLQPSIEPRDDGPSELASHLTTDGGVREEREEDSANNPLEELERGRSTTTPRSLKGNQDGQFSIKPPFQSSTVNVCQVTEVEDEFVGNSSKRYWKDSNGISCFICQENTHQARDCDHQYCLTCGAIDEHSTRNCPVSLVCYACGSRGHLSRHCPSSSMASGKDCATCKSRLHLTMNCSSIWRRYQEETNRNPKLVMPACYNCGDTGDHFGDDCPFNRTMAEPTAFSSRVYPRGTMTMRDSHHSRETPMRMYKDDQWPNSQKGKRTMAIHDDEPPEWRRRKPEKARAGRDRVRKDHHEQEDDDYDWFSRRSLNNANRTPKGSAERKGSRRDQARVGGSYRGGYNKR